MLTPEQLVESTLAYYQSKLAEETERFGVMACADEFVKSNATQIYLSKLWGRISAQSGLYLYVNGSYGDPQIVYAILSKERMLRPEQYHLLGFLISEVRRELALSNIGECLERFDAYEGPYKLNMPKEYLENS